MRVVLVPGFNGTAKQPLLVRLAKRLRAAGLEAEPVTLARGRPSPGLAREADELDALCGGGPVAVVGRSFGGRVAARLAARRSLLGLVLLGFPVRPPGKKRPEDEAALEALNCPVLVLQGEKDELGAPALLRRLVKGKPNVALEVVRGAGHSFGRREAEALDRAAQWLAALDRA